MFGFHYFFGASRFVKGWQRNAYDTSFNNQNLYPPENIDQYGKTEQENQAGEVNIAFNFAIDWFATNPLNDGENDLWAVERGDWKQVEHSQIDTYHGDDFEQGA